MRKTMRVAVAVIIACGIALTASFGFGTELTDMAHTKRPIKVYLGEFSNASGQTQISADTLKKEVEKAFTERRSVSFSIVKSPQESDIQVSAVIKGYQYMERSPVKPNISVIMALDAVTPENYAELTGEFTIIDTKSGNVLMKEEITGYKKRMMTPEKSISVVYDRLAKKFVAYSFGKGD